jgi:hypothetical protein
MSPSQKEWVTPQLIVLGRTMPEEHVLTSCKGGSIPTSSPSTGEQSCKKTQSQSECAACQGIVPS